MELRLATELVSNHGLQVPLTRKYSLVPILEVLESPPQPGEAALGIVESGFWLACERFKSEKNVTWSEQLAVGFQNEVAEPVPHFVPID